MKKQKPFIVGDVLIRPVYDAVDYIDFQNWVEYWQQVEIAEIEPLIVVGEGGAPDHGHFPPATEATKIYGSNEED